MNERELVQLSKKMSRALRHQPGRYGLMLDGQGWTNLADLLVGLQQRHRGLASVTKADVAALLARPGKQRFECKDGRIRALYGHSLARKIIKETAVPPEFLYHGTSPQVIAVIKQTGLKPMKRQYVHLSVDVATARLVGGRKHPHPVILQVYARQAHETGLHFYHGNDGTWLADHIPPEFLQAIRAD